MTIKRKTQLNLSGSHRNLDADFAHIGSTLFVTGSAQFTGSVNVDDVLSASGDLSTAGILRVQGATQLTGAVNLASSLSASGTLHIGAASTFNSATFAGTVSASNMISTANNLQVGQNAFVTGSLQVTGSIFVAAAGLISASVVSASVGVSASVLQGTTVTAEGLVSGSTGRFTYLSGALSASSTGQPFIVAGSGVTTTFSHTNLNWTIAAAGGGGTPNGADRTVQFNNNGAFAGDVDLQFYSNSLGNIGANTLAFPSGNVGVLSGSNIDNQAYTLALSAAVAQPIPGGPYPGFFDPAMVVLTPVLMSQSLMLFDGRHDPLGLGNANVPGGGLVLANDAQFTLYNGSWNPLPSDFGGKDPLVSILNQGEMGIISVVGQLTVHSSSTDQNNIFQVGASNTAGQVQLANVGTADFISGAVRLTYGSDFTVFSGSGGTAQFKVTPSTTANQIQLTNVGTADFVSGAVNLTYGSTLNVHSGSLAATGFAVIPDTTAGTVRLDINGRLFSNGTNISALTGSVRTGVPYGEPVSNVISGALLTADMVNGSVGKFRVEVIGADINGAEFIAADLIVAASKSVAGVYGTFGVTEVTLDAIGTYAPAWDVNINTNGDIAVTSSNVGVNWYAQVSKKMILSGSGIVIY